MSRLQRGLSSFNGNGTRTLGGSLAGGDRQGAKSFEELKRLIHSKLVDKLDLSRVSDLDNDTLRREIRLVLETRGAPETPSSTAWGANASSTRCSTRRSASDRWRCCSRTRPSATSSSTGRTRS